MTSRTPPELTSLILRSPDAVLAAIPYLLGFHPVQSAVALWLRDRRIVLTQRLDLPLGAEQHEQWLAALWNHSASDSADEVILVLATPDPADPRLLAMVLERAELSGLGVRDVLRVDAGRWWSLLCSDEGCCPSMGRDVDAGTAASVAAEFTVVGCAPLADREHLERSLGPDVVKQALVAAALTAAARMPTGRDREPWRDERISVALRTLGAAGEAPPRAETVADLLRGLADVRVRDTVLWEVSRWEPDRLPTVLDRLGILLRGAPPGHVAPVATLTAIVAWLLGDGARAQIAVVRARQDDHEYSLAQLVGASLGAGLPPAAWRESMAGLSRDVCRHGSTQERRAAS
jgi:hypothetical protein